MKRLRVATIVGTRPEIIRLSRTISVLNRELDHVLIHTGQNYDHELNQVFFEDLEIRKPDYFLDAAGETAAETIANVIVKSDALLRRIEPDAVLILGDTNSCLAAISAKRLKIPIFHMEAGNRCFDQRVPEEINRRIVDVTADINLPYSSISRDYLVREGFPPDRIIKTGSPMFEVLQQAMPKIRASDILVRLGLAENDYFVVSAHREENLDLPGMFPRLVGTLNAVAKAYDRRLIFSTHPRTRKRIEAEGLPLHPRIETLKPLGFLDYNRLQIGSKAVLSDSGTISEEASILNFRALNLREAHERPEAFEEASVMMTGLNSERVLQALTVLEGQPSGEHRLLRLVEDYSQPNVSEKVLRIILSYTDYVNRVVWKKSESERQEAQDS